MRSTFGIFFSLLALALAWQDLLLYAVFKIEQDKLAATVCQNKDLPELECKAACYFQTALQEEHEKEQNPQTALHAPKEKTPLQTPEPAMPLPFKVPTSKTKAFVPYKAGSLSSPFAPGIFKPPASPA